MKPYSKKKPDLPKDIRKDTYYTSTHQKYIDELRELLGEKECIIIRLGIVCLYKAMFPNKKI